MMLQVGDSTDSLSALLHRAPIAAAVVADTPHNAAKHLFDDGWRSKYQDDLLCMFRQETMYWHTQCEGRIFLLRTSPEGERSIVPGFEFPVAEGEVPLELSDPRVIERLMSLTKIEADTLAKAKARAEEEARAKAKAATTPGP